MSKGTWELDPRRLAIMLSRYKFVSKMLSGHQNTIEIGCGDAFASRIVQQEVPNLTVVDIEPKFIADIDNRNSTRWPLNAVLHNILEGPVRSDVEFDSAYSLDVLEHIDVSEEDTFLTNIKDTVKEKGVVIIGMPSLESQRYASPASKAGHINCKTGADLKSACERHFSHVFLFSMNDEVVHTGYYPMAHYLLALCVK
ncbi:class I SAM-dependent methyltransferase [Pseudoalteromonas piscicida]|nr:methyltransferase domain-containing protein [Pseudoalteromonas piscicida]